MNDVSAGHTTKRVYVQLWVVNASTRAAVEMSMRDFRAFADACICGYIDCMRVSLNSQHVNNTQKSSSETSHDKTKVYLYMVMAERTIVQNNDCIAHPEVTMSATTSVSSM